MKYSVSPYPDSCCCGLRHFLLTSDRSWVAEAMSCVTSSWRNEAISMVTCVFFSFALVETLLSCPSCAWREDRLILPSFRWKGFSGRTWLKAVVSWCFGWVQSPNDVIQRLTTTPWNILRQSCLLSVNLSTQNLSKNGTVPLGGKLSPVFEKCAKVIFKLGTGHYLLPGGEDLGLNKVKFTRSPLWMLLHWSGQAPLITSDVFGDPPPLPSMSSFSKQIWVVPPLNPSKVFSDPPFWVISYDWSRLLFSQNSSDPP